MTQKKGRRQKLDPPNGPLKWTTKWTPKWTPIWNPLKNEITAVIVREVQSLLSCRPIRLQRRQRRRGRNSDEPRDKAPRALSLLLEFARSSGWAEGLSRWLSMRGVPSSSSPRCHEFSQFHYILCFRGCRNRKSWSEVLEKPQKSASSLPRSSFLTIPNPQLRPLPKATSTPPLSNSMQSLPRGYLDPRQAFFPS